MSLLDARLLVVLYDGGDTVEVLLSSDQPVGALPRLAQVRGLEAGVAGATRVGLAPFALLASSADSSTAPRLTLGLSKDKIQLLLDKANAMDELTLSTISVKIGSLQRRAAQRCG